MDVERARPNSIRGPVESFTGEVWIDLIVMANEPSRLRALSVHFLPGSRTAWHSHPVGQVLVVTEGTGRVQSRGGEVEEIRQGDVVSAAPDEWHWHGAAPDSFMTHLALQEAGPDGSEVAWGAHVTDSEYLTSSP